MTPKEQKPDVKSATRANEACTLEQDISSPHRVSEVARSRGYDAARSRQHEIWTTSAPRYSTEEQTERTRNCDDGSADEHHIVTPIYSHQRESDQSRRQFKLCVSKIAPGPRYHHSEFLNTKLSRRKEQCRVNQANYRRRKRMQELELVGQIRVLQREISDLNRLIKGASSTLPLSDLHIFSKCRVPDPMKIIYEFYKIFQDSGPSCQFGTHHNMLSLFTLQEYRSMNQLLSQWQQYRKQFSTFFLTVEGIQTLQSSDLLFVRVCASLHVKLSHIGMTASKIYRNLPESSHDPMDILMDKVLLCPVLQIFAFDEAEGTITQILSQVDWLVGILGSPSAIFEREMDVEGGFKVLNQLIRFFT